MAVYDISDSQPDDRVSDIISRGNCDGIILKLGETLNKVPTLDDKFVMFVNQVVEAGLPYGIYYVSHAENMNEFMMEAQWINDQVADLLAGTEPSLGTWWDMEVPAVKRDGITQELLDAIGTMQAWWSSHKIGIYAQYSYFTDYLDLDKLAEYQIPIWVAQYCYHENSLKAEYPQLNHVAYQWTTHGENAGEDYWNEYGAAQDEDVWYGFPEN